MAAPNTVSAHASVTTSQASAGRISDALVAIAADDATRRLPARIVSQPETGIATNDPAPSPAIAAPSAAGDSASASCTCGIREAQEAKASPHRKNSPPMAILAARIALVGDTSIADSVAG